MPIFPNERRHPWPTLPEHERPSATPTWGSTEAELAALRDQLRAARTENEQLHAMVAEQARTITAVQQLVGAPAPAVINASIDVRLDIGAELSPAMRKEIEAFTERLQRIDHDPVPR